VIYYTTGPQTRKRKANDSFQDASHAKALKKAPLLDRPATPVTEQGSPAVSVMESEDEFLSDVTSQEDEDFDEGTQDSDDGSLGQGKPVIQSCLSAWGGNGVTNTMPCRF
jgi:hypothetical protein